ncbi:hypothetical protein K432DRAFT_421279 [Lepidopterella palustris CBS 459.81]|uniref:HNH nuclease domain-containing protein n=1 Tax=Lepidopterella palustris CBS 459.81 TaxID=1314670 RepID=A0A8E2ELN9_9PEZI|nr:hypothetical protein K432DRAFT_421279 [Lepidopterella palustris CBS 459.81]
MASEGGPDAEFHDPVRIELLEALQTALGVDVIAAPTAWACLWLSDIERLRDIVREAQTPSVFIIGTFEHMEHSARIVPQWTQRTRLSSTASTPQQPSTPQRPSSAQQSSPAQQLSPAQQSSPAQQLYPAQQPSPAQGSLRGQKQRRCVDGQLAITRSKLQKDLCFERDQKQCILTKAGEPIDVAHIYPFSMRYEYNTVNRTTPSFWNILRLFWSDERVNGWYNAIFPLGTEICYNLICLCPNAHRYWEKAYFALKPIRLSNDKKRLDVQFFWLPPRHHVYQVGILQRPSLPSALDRGPNKTMLFNLDTCKKICSGDEISLETDDPVSRPLPDFRVLEMQWYLHRVTAMSGAAEAQDDFCGGDDSDDDLALPLQNRWNLYTEDEWDMGIEEEPDMDNQGSSSTPILASSSPERLVLQLPEDNKFEHAAAASEREGPEIFGQGC